ncbi:MAG: PDZ domain-containing protein [Pirellulales bacterium]
MRSLRVSNSWVALPGAVLLMAVTGLSLGGPPKRPGAPDSASLPPDSASRPSGSIQADSRPTTPLERAYLGVATEAAPQILAAHLPDLLEPEVGLVVTDVTPDSPAAVSGLRRHDILVRYNDTTLSTPRQLRELVGDDEPGNTVALEVIRAGTLEWLSVTLAPQVISAPRASKPRTGESGAAAPEKADRSVNVAAYSFSDGLSHVSLTSRDGTWFTATVEIQDENGRTQRRTLKGTREQLAAQLAELPAGIRGQISQWLNSAKPRAGERRPLMPFDEP